MSDVVLIAAREPPEAHHDKDKEKEVVQQADDGNRIWDEIDRADEVQEDQYKRNGVHGPVILTKQKNLLAHPLLRLVLPIEAAQKLSVGTRTASSNVQRNDLWRKT
jgi:hypothetical protein